MADLFPTEIRVLPTGMPRDHPEARHFAITITYRGTYTRRGETEPADWYSVDSRGSAQLSRAGNWKWFVDRFQRWQYRHSYEEAVVHATREVELVTLGDKTFTEWAHALEG